MRVRRCLHPVFFSFLVILTNYLTVIKMARLKEGNYMGETAWNSGYLIGNLCIRYLSH